MKTLAQKQKSQIPACPLGKQLSNFACPASFLFYFLFSWHATCLGPYFCPSGKQE